MSKQEVIRFLSQPTGRMLRVVVGAVLIVWAVWSLVGAGKWVALVLGIVFALSGTLNFCGISKLLGGSFWGKNNS